MADTEALDSLSTSPQAPKVLSINEHPAVQQLISKIKLLPRDKTKYPEFSKEDILDFSSFMYFLNIAGSAGDGNLTSLIHNLWKNLSLDIQDPINGGMSDDLAKAIVSLHDYLKAINFFQDEEPKA